MPDTPAPNPGGDPAASNVRQVLRGAWSHPNQFQQPLDGHGLAYFDELVVEYKSLPGSTPAQAAAHAAVKDAVDTALAKAGPSSASQGATAVDVHGAFQAAVQASMPAAAEQSTRGLIDQLIRKREENKLIWNDILVFESALLSLLPKEKLLRAFQSKQQEYQELAGADALQAWKNSLPAGLEAGTDLPNMLAATQSLTRDLHWSYTTFPVQEQQRERFAKWVVVWLTAIGLCAVTLYWRERFSTTAAVLVCGAVGACLSALIRIQSPWLGGNALLNLRKSSYWLTVLLSPVVGGISALVLSLIFTCGAIRGPFFPAVTLTVNSDALSPNRTHSTNASASFPLNITEHLRPAITALGRSVSSEKGAEPETPESESSDANKDSKADEAADSRPVPVAETNVTTRLSSANGTSISINEFTHSYSVSAHRWTMTSGADLALLLLWSFLAGFSERLVPDMMSRLTEKAKAKATM
jgi:hypothetical protein